MPLSPGHVPPKVGPGLGEANKSELDKGADFQDELGLSILHPEVARRL